MKMNCCKDCPCVGYAQCCHFEKRADFTPEEELKIKKALFSKTGALYPHPFKQHTINVTPKEKEVLQKIADERGIKIDFSPKKVFLTDKGIIVYDFFVNHKVCPFLKGNRCTVYKDRPDICKQFPHVKYDNTGFSQFLGEQLTVKFNYDQALEYVKKNVEVREQK